MPRLTKSSTGEKVGLILDTSFLIALNNATDASHEQAESLRTRLENREFGQLYISDYVFDEFVTFLMAKSFPANAIMEIGDALLADESIKLMKIDDEMFIQSWELFKKMKNLSFTDCTTVILAKEFNIKNIASFDSGFDRFPNIKRV